MKEKLKKLLCIMIFFTASAYPQIPWQWMNVAGGTPTDGKPGSHDFYLGYGPITNINFNSGKMIAVDDSGNTYGTATYDCIINFLGHSISPLSKSNNNTVIVFKITPTGSLAWYQTIGNINGNCLSNGISLDLSHSSFFITGWYNTSTSPAGVAITFPTTPATNFHITDQVNNDYDGFVTKFDLNGNCLWAVPLYGSSSHGSYANAISADNLGNVYVTAYTKNDSVIIGSPQPANSSPAYYFNRRGPADYHYVTLPNPSGSGLTALSFTPNGSLFAAAKGTGLYYSPSKGITWSTIGTGLPNQNINSVIARSGTSCWTGIQGQGIYLTTNSGTSWTAVNGITSPLTSLNISCMVSNSKFIVGTSDSGVFYSASGPTIADNVWTQSNDGLTNLNIKTLFFPYYSGTRLYAGTSSGVWYNTDIANSAAWTNISDANLTNTMTVTCFTGGTAATDWVMAGTSANGVFLLPNGSSTWSALSGLPLGDSITSLATNGNTVLAGTRAHGVYTATKTAADGSAWTSFAPFNDGVTNNSINDIITEGYGSVYYVATQNGLFYNILNNTRYAKTNTYVAKLDGSGTCLWIQAPNSALLTNGDAQQQTTNAITADASGCYVSGWLGNPYEPMYFPGISTYLASINSSTTRSPFYFKYDANGNDVWAHSTGVSNQYCLFNQIVLDDNGNPIMSGYVQGGPYSFSDGVTLTNPNGSGFSPLLAKFNKSTGNCYWSICDGTVSGPSVGNTPRGYGLAFNPIGHKIYTTGTYRGITTFGGVVTLPFTNGTNGNDYIAEYLDNGLSSPTFFAVDTIQGSGNWLYLGTIDVNNHDQVAFMGQFTATTITSGAGTFAKTSTNTLDNDIFIGKLNTLSVPIELTSFTASVDNENILLKWQTATELNNSGFNIERLKNNSWVMIGFVKGSGNSTTVKNYSYVDHSQLTGKIIYRLKQVDLNGTFKYSNLVEVNLGLPQNYALYQNYPNPFNPSTTIKFSLPQATHVSLRIYNSLGQEVAVLMSKDMNAGYYNTEWNASGFASGIYFYRIQAGSFVDTRKLILVK